MSEAASGSGGPESEAGAESTEPEPADATQVQVAMSEAIRTLRGQLVGLASFMDPGPEPAPEDPAARTLRDDGPPGGGSARDGS